MMATAGCSEPDDVAMATDGLYGPGVGDGLPPYSTKLSLAGADCYATLVAPQWSDGAGGVVGQLTITSSGFDVSAVSRPAAMTARTGFAAAWSTTAQYLLLAGGSDSGGESQADVWRWSAASGAWSTGAITGGLSPENALAATYSSRDQRLWIVDAREQGLLLLRLNPATGQILTEVSLEVLEDLSEVWLTTLEDGHVLLAGNHALGARLSVLDAKRFDDGASVDVVGALEIAGPLAAVPAVRNGRLTLAREALNEERRTEMVLETLLVSELISP